MSLNQPPFPTNSIEDSLRNGHEAAYRASNLLDAIWSDLTGENACEATEPHVGAIIYSADHLATKVSVLADRLEAIRTRIASPKVVAMNQVQYNAANPHIGKY